MPAVQETIERVRRIGVHQYKYGFVTDIESDKAPKGLSEDIVRFISAKKTEPEWMLAWRLEGYRPWLTLGGATWARVGCPSAGLRGPWWSPRRSTTRIITITPPRRRRRSPPWTR